MSSNREASKAMRRTVILDAALDLLDIVPAAELTTEQIATKAQVSHATVFNLVGTRQDLMFALIERQVTQMGQVFVGQMDRLLAHPLQGAASIIEQSVSGFLSRSEAFQQIFVEVACKSGTFYKTRHFACLAECMKAAQDRGTIDVGFDPVGIALQAHSTYGMALLCWASGQLDDEGCRLAARHGLLTVLASVTVGQHQESIRAELSLLTKELVVAYGL